MRQLQTKPFPYFVGIYSLEEMVTKDSRVCVINIQGGESRKVTPVSHEYSGGNVVAGVQYGREGIMETELGEIPVYPSVREVMKAGHHFDVGVIYLPPAAVSQAVSELVSFNHDLKRIIIVTEKVSTADSRNIRFLCQEAGVDVVGCNCLGVANAWDHVRIGGALGGDKPEETLRKGSVAIHSNSGNFTTTIGEYLRTAGFGISTAVSSGKDVYIHFALPEFLYAAQNDPRTKAVALYVEPGGYYEKTALDWIRQRKFGFNKPIVVCVTGRWKKDISRSCGHAGALAGSGDDAESKEDWFDKYFGVPVFDPENPKVSKRGVRVESIQAFPQAMQAVYDEIGEELDFESSGDLNLKLWLSDNFMPLPAELDLPIITPLSPYDEQMESVKKQVGAHPLRQNMRNASGASRMEPNTQVSELHGKSILQLSKLTLEENIFFTLAKVLPPEEDTRTLNLLLNCFLKLEEGEIDQVLRAREMGAMPNAYLASVLAAQGAQPRLLKAKEHMRFVIDLIRNHKLDDRMKRLPVDLEDEIREALFEQAKGELDEQTQFLLKEVKKSKKDCLALRVCQFILGLAERNEMQVRDLHEFLLASMAVCIFWRPMVRKRITRLVLEDSLEYLAIISKLFACGVVDPEGNAYWKKLTGSDMAGLRMSFSENAFRILFSRKPGLEELDEFKYLMGLTLTNGPGTLSAKGAKETVSARNHISMAFVGFLTGTGLAHGGNGFEAVEFLLKNFQGSGLKDPGDAKHGIDLRGMAEKAASEYGEFKREQKSQGVLRVKPIPCVNHPVFKGNSVNIDPREDFIRKELADRNISNVFLDFYHHLVQELHEQGITKNVFCVNIDAVLAVISLKLVWREMGSGKMSDEQIQNLVFTLFLFGRSMGVAAEIADHRDRGTDMDCRTPQSQLSFVL
ncbi:CoA-binding protein [bacterium]|nr:CoA-binding protein [bacterium]